MDTDVKSKRQSLWDVQAAAGEPSAIVRVRNLQTTIQGSASMARGISPIVPDAWGRDDRAQPLLVSAEVQLVQGFQQASSSDTVAADTVHYGTLSKAIRDVLSGAGGSGHYLETFGFDHVLNTVWVRLTGRRLNGTLFPEVKGWGPPLLTPEHVRLLRVTLFLPKASLVGDGVSLTGSAVLGSLDTVEGVNVPGPHALHLRLHGLRVPVLVGVHPHERQARQTVVANVGVDFLSYEHVYPGKEAKLQLPSAYPLLEQRVVDVMQASAFETLEALAAEVAKAALAWPGGEIQAGEEASLLPRKRVHVALEKPMAVPFADAPIVELVVDQLR